MKKIWAIVMCAIFTVIQPKAIKYGKHYFPCEYTWNQTSIEKEAEGAFAGQNAIIVYSVTAKSDYIWQWREHWNDKEKCSSDAVKEEIKKVFKNSITATKISQGPGSRSETPINSNEILDSIKEELWQKAQKSLRINCGGSKYQCKAVKK